MRSRFERPRSDEFEPFGALRRYAVAKSEGPHPRFCYTSSISALLGPFRPFWAVGGAEAGEIR